MLRWVFSASLISLAAFAFLFTSTSVSPPSQPVRFSHKLHLDYFRDRGENGHRQSMISMHKERILKEVEDEELVGEMMKMVEEGNCTLCHRDFDENVQDMAKLLHCAECHRVFLEHDWEGRADQRPCIGCHNAVVQSAQASIPGTNTCAACHLPALGDDPEEIKLLEFIEHERMISWRPVYDHLPGEVVFSHERHVELGRVRCQECHGPVELAEGSPSIKVGMKMEDCVACHELFGADNDCLVCHR